MRLLTDDCGPLWLVNCEKCIYCHVNGAHTSWTCERQYPPRPTFPDGFCNAGEMLVEGQIKKTGDFKL